MDCFKPITSVHYRRFHEVAFIIPVIYTWKQIYTKGKRYGGDQNNQELWLLVTFFKYNLKSNSGVGKVFTEHLCRLMEQGEQKPLSLHPGVLAVTSDPR